MHKTFTTKHFTKRLPTTLLRPNEQIMIDSWFPYQIDTYGRMGLFTFQNS
jgi:hypothetical protein